MTLRLGMCSHAHGHARSYAACLQRAPDVEVAGVWDDEPDRLARATREFGLAPYTALDALLDSGLDGLIVCSANADHRRHVEAAAGRVPYILCEKPIAATRADAQAMIDVCAAARTRLQIAFPVRFAPAAAETRRLLARGVLGRVYSAACTNHGTMPGGWFADRAQAGGGAVMDHTVHVIDLLRWFWDTEVTEVYAEIGVGLLHPNLAIDDVGLLSFRLANGAYGTLDTSWSRPPGHRTRGNVTMELVGSRGVLTLDAFRQHLTVTNAEAGRTRWQPWGVSPDQGLIDDFLDMIRTEREPSITGRDGLQALQVALAAYESARTGQPVSLKPET